MSAFTLPGDLVSPVAGPLLRRGAPVVKTWNTPVMPGDDPADAFTARGVMLRQKDADTWLCWYDHERIGNDSSGCVWLDLSDPAGRDIAARWLAKHHGLTVGATAPIWLWCPLSGEYAWRLDSWDDERYFASTDLYDPEVSAPRSVIPGISQITDPTEALRAACLAAVGMTG